MIDIKPYIDQLDILSHYIKYWVEFQDKEKIKEENVLKNAIRSDFMCEVSKSGLDIEVEFDNRSSGVFAPEKKYPLPFSSITKTYNKLKAKNVKSPKESIIKSINKFV